MTVTAEAIETKFINAYQADKPCFIVNNVLVGSGLSGQTNKWYRAATGSTVAYADMPTFAAVNDGILADLSALPISYTHDYRSSLYSSPADAGANNNYYWGLYATRWNTLVGASYSLYPQSYYVDAIAIKASAWGKGDAATYLTNTVEIDVYMNTATDFAPGTTTQIFNGTVYADDPTSDPNPLKSGTSHTTVNVVPSSGNYRYKIEGDTYFRADFAMKGGGSAYWTSALKVGEVFIGERIQLSRNPNQPYMTELSYTDNTTNFESMNGDIVRYVRSKGQRRFELNFTPTGDDSYGIDDLEQIKLLVKKTEQFTKPFMFVPKPYTEPNNCYFVYAEDAAFNLEAVGPFERSVTLSLVEIPPFVAYEVGTG